ncbi:MAG TPA: Asd/ArgC dimerization domain-containing protein [Thermoanaerobaculia bacterium]|nr:Asd/ArgC dimerization domain-containing protein [Thermoanaerobaculia bacterium]
MPQPKSSAGYRIGIINPMTLVGNEIKTILRERSFPFAKVVLLDSTGEASGALTDIGDEAAIVTAISAEELSDLDLAFFCGPAAGNAEWIARAAQDGFIAIDLSQPSSSEDGKLAVAGINLDELLGDDPILISPHPVAVPLALILREVQRVAPIDLVTATVVQPASEFDTKGVEELAQQTIAVLNIQTVPHEVFDRQLAFNLYPALEHNEAFIVTQVRSLIDARTEVALMITQGTIFHGHTFALFVKLREEANVDAIADALRENPVFAFQEGDQQFGTIDAAGKDEVLIAEVRRDPSVRNGLWIWAVCDNLRRASALNAVLIAEKVLFGAGLTN